ncbi:hypothetical protein QE408_004183 [Agrobacterium larrymoorei]|uniref:Uncharacterized protein n=1 Tax=Agrobacterium larrymoorei TaxID=160699 RepID=A0ABU0UPY8_9HYPH|nr:hypothetical protein [Agrobacterium larrymoorei]
MLAARFSRYLREKVSSLTKLDMRRELAFGQSPPLRGEMSGRTEGGMLPLPTGSLNQVITVGASRPVCFLIPAIVSAAAIRSASASWVSIL